MAKAVLVLVALVPIKVVSTVMLLESPLGNAGPPPVPTTTVERLGNGRPEMAAMEILEVLAVDGGWARPLPFREAVDHGVICDIDRVVCAV